MDMLSVVELSVESMVPNSLAYSIGYQEKM